MIAQILTPWKTEGMFTSPMLLFDYPEILSYVNITNQPGENIIPDPNLFVAQVTCTPETLALIEADPLYKILWSESQ